jgi:hypothetical protein
MPSDSPINAQEGGHHQLEHPEIDPSDDQAAMAAWSKTWGRLFGLNTAQVLFPDHELNARVYTLDGETGYNVHHKKVFGPSAIPDESEESQRLTYPKKARRGENHGRARLVKEDIVKIRTWAADLTARGEVPAWTAKATEYNVSEGTLRDIVNRRTWIHV